MVRTLLRVSSHHPFCSLYLYFRFNLNRNLVVGGFSFCCWLEVLCFLPCIALQKFTAELSGMFRLPCWLSPRSACAFLHRDRLAQRKVCGVTGILEASTLLGPSACWFPWASSPLLSGLLLSSQLLHLIRWLRVRWVGGWIGGWVSVRSSRDAECMGVFFFFFGKFRPWVSSCWRIWIAKCRV